MEYISKPEAEPYIRSHIWASDNGETRFNYDFNVKKDYFGFYLYNDRTRNPTEFIPKSITRGFIKSHRKNAETDIQFFMREQNEDVSSFFKRKMIKIWYCIPSKAKRDPKVEPKKFGWKKTKQPMNKNKKVRR